MVLKRWGILREILWKCADYRNLWASKRGSQTPVSRAWEKPARLAKPVFLSGFRRNDSTLGVLTPALAPPPASLGEPVFGLIKDLGQIPGPTPALVMDRTC